MSEVWIVTLNGYVHEVCATAEKARAVMRQVRDTLARAGKWSPVGGDPETATAWSATQVTSLAMKPYRVEA